MKKGDKMIEAQSSEPLRLLLTQYEEATAELNASIDKLTMQKNLHEIAKGEVTKNQHKLNLVKEQIMLEKKLIQV